MVVYFKEQQIQRKFVNRNRWARKGKLNINTEERKQFIFLAPCLSEIIVFFHSSACRPFVHRILYKYAQDVAFISSS